MIDLEIITIGDENLENILAQKLTEKGLTLGLAESCTGGRLAGLFTAMPGSSRYFLGGVVSYSNEAKHNILGVRTSDLEQHGAVSKEVIEQMVAGAQRIFNSDCAIATSGIAGPGGGTPDKPVGTVWIAASYRDRTCVQLFHFTKNRESNIFRACYAGIQLLLRLIE